MTEPRTLLVHAYGESASEVTAALRAGRNAAQALPHVHVEVIVQGVAVTAVTIQAGLEEDLTATMRLGVTVVACRNSMERARVDPAHLVAGVGVVPAAVVHLAQRQWAGAAYVRV